MTTDDDQYAAYIEQAMATRGGHLHIGRGGFTLQFRSSRLSGYDCGRIKSLCIAAGVPVIDSRTVPMDIAAKLSISGPMIAVDTEPDPRPWHAFSYAPLGVVAAAYQRAGAEVFNIGDEDLDDTGFPALPNVPLETIIDGWLDYVRNSEF